MMGSVFLFFGNAISFNVPGAPVVVRVIFTTVFVGGLGWAFLAMLRGVKA